MLKSNSSISSSSKTLSSYISLTTSIYLSSLSYQLWSLLYKNEITLSNLSSTCSFAILVNKFGKLDKATLRCNHVGVVGSADNQYNSYAELSKIAGFNVEEEVLKYDFKEFSIDKLFTIYDGVLIRASDDTEIYNDITEYTIPDGTIIIGARAFENCRHLTSIKIPASVTSIGESAFYNCSSLTSIEIPNSVTSIGYGTFDNCSPNLTVFTDNEYATQYCNSNGIKCAPLSEYHKS